MGTPNKDRQSAFKERMRQEGKVMRTLWLDSAQAETVKAVLAGEPLPVTDDRATDALKARVAELEAEIASLNQNLAVARKLEQKANLECIDLLNKQQVVAQDMQRQREELKAAKKAGIKGTALSAPDARERATAILEQINQRTTWDGEKRDRSAQDTRVVTERLANLVRQTKAARTAMAKAEVELSGVVTEGEKEALELARRALFQILEAADIAKERGRRLAKNREDHESACNAAAEKAIAEIIQPASIEEQVVLIMAPGRPESWSDAADLVSGEAFSPTYRDAWGKEHPQDILARTLANAVRDAINRLVGQVVLSIKEPAEALAKAQAIRNEIEAKRPALLTQHAELIRRIKAELVLRRMEKAAEMQE